MRLHEPEKRTRHVIFILLFFIDGFIIPGAQEQAGDEGNREGERYRFPRAYSVSITSLCHNCCTGKNQ